MLIQSGTPTARAASTPARSGVLHSMNTAAPNGSSAASAVTIWFAPGRNRYISGTPSLLATTACWPRARSARASASVDPRQSPSGETWLRSSTRRPRSVSAIRSAGVIRGPGRRAPWYLPQQAVDAVALLDRFVDPEGHLGRVAQPDPVRQFGAHEPLRAPQALHRARLRLGVPVHAHEDPGVAEVGTELDVGDGDEPDARVPHVALQNRAGFLFEELAETGDARTRHDRPLPYRSRLRRTSGRLRSLLPAH